MSAEIDAVTQIGGGAVGIAGISYVIWKLYGQIKSDVKQDAKGDKVDDRINNFTTQLQAQLDKAIVRSDNLQVAFNQLQKECNIVSAQLATAQARAEFLAKENQDLRDELGAMRGRITAEGMKNG